MKKKDVIDSDVPAFVEIVKRCYSYAEVARALNFKVTSDMVTLIRSRIKHYSVDISHFTGAAWTRGKNKFNDNIVAGIAKKKEHPWEEVFVENCLFTIHNTEILKRLIIARKKKYECEKCGIQQWNGVPIRLQLHHINGLSNDNRIENLKVLCANCHTQTETFCMGNGRLDKQTRRMKSAIWWKDLSSGKTIDEVFPIKPNSERVRSSVPKTPRIRKHPKGTFAKKFCKICGQETDGLKTGLCGECYRGGARKFEISKENLERLVWEIPTEKIAARFGVSGKAIEKRCKKFGIQKPPRGYWAKKQSEMDILSKFIIEKDVLERLVWEKSLTKIGEQFGVDHVTVSAKCKKYGIEIPPPGYWATKEI